MALKSKNVTGWGLLAVLSACTGEIGELADEGGPSAGPAGTSSGQPGQDPQRPGTPAGPSGPTASPPGMTSGPSAPPTFSCAASATPAALPLRRLSELQYKNALRELLVFGLGGTAPADAVMAAIRTPLAELPADEPARIPEAPDGSYVRLAQDVQQRHIDGYHAVAVGVGSQLGRRERLATLLGSCAVDAAADNDGACVDAFIRRFGERAFRRPLADEDLAFYRRYYGGAVTGGIDPAGIGDIVAGILSSPYFVYLVEHGDLPQAGRRNVFSLGPFETAARLSFQFWDSAPDEALLAAARTGALRDQAGYERELARVLADPRTQRTFDGFFSDYFRLQDIPEATTSAGFRALSADNPLTPAVRQDMQRELLDFARHHSFTVPGRFDDLLTSEAALPRSQALASLYGVAPWNGDASPAAFTGGQRPGFLTRAGMLFSGIVRTRPIHKGAFIRKWVLCDQVPPPPDNAANAPTEAAGRTSREGVEALTEQPGTSCAACHTRLVNPLGFATEGFDPLGRHRTEERLFDSNGRETGRRPVNTSVVPYVTPDDARPARGPADLARMIAESGKAHACFSRHYFRFTFGRWEGEPDGCTLDGLRKSLSGPDGLRGFFRAVALAPSFRERLID